MRSMQSPGKSFWLFNYSAFLIEIQTERTQIYESGQRFTRVRR